MPNALDIPEIRAQVASFLRLSAIAKCARVSCAWNATFAPHLWRDIHLEWKSSERPDSPGFQLIRKNSPFIQILDIKLSLGAILPILHFPSVRDLTIQIPKQRVYYGYYENENEQGTDPDADPRGDQDIVDFLNRHQQSNGGRVSRLKIELSLLRDSYWPTITTWRNLTLCQIRNGRVRYQDWDMCWKMWSEIETLHLDFVQFLGVYLTLDGPGERRSPVHLYPSKTKSLRLLQLFEFHFMDQIRWIEQCPLLERLDWRLPQDNTSSDAIKGLVQSLEKGACPRLTQLILDSEQLRDKSSYSALLSLMETLPPLKVLSMERRELGSPFWMTVKVMPQGHFATLQELTICESGQTVQLLLCSLPNLEKFRASKILFSDIYHDGRPWVCKGLKSLDLFFVLDSRLPIMWFAPGFGGYHSFSEFPSPVDQQDQIFDRLAELTQLQILDIGSRPGVTYNTHSLILRVSHGLNKLGSLKRLTTLRHQNTKQQLQEEDVLWMLSHWPWLERKQGLSNGDPKVEMQLNCIFRQAGVDSRAAN